MNYDELQKSQIQKWLRSTLKKQPFFLFEENPTNNFIIIFNDKNKTKIGVVKNNMYCRYGIRVFGSISSNENKIVSPLSFRLWQQSTNAVSNHQLQEMINVYNNSSTLHVFNFNSINIKY